MGFASKKPPGSVPDAVAKAKRLSAMPVRAALEVSPPFSHNQSMNPSVTREELDAKLAANVAEVKSVAHEMRADISGLKADMVEKMSELRAENQAQCSSLVEKMNELRADNHVQFSAINERMAGIQTFMETQAAKADAEAVKTSARFFAMDTKLDCVEKSLEHKIDVLQRVMSIVAALMGVWIGYLQIR